VYDLFCPLKKAPFDAKNKAFVLAYVLPAFGSDESLRRKASPLLLLNPDKDTSLLGSTSMSLRRLFYSWSSSKDMDDEEQEEQQNDKDDKRLTTDESQGEQENSVDDIEINTAFLPRTLILNAALDMGLQENGELMAAAMAKHTSVEYYLVPGTDHASICWNKDTFVAIRKFMGLNE
jgi:acetyl esterase/lipase